MCVCVCVFLCVCECESKCECESESERGSEREKEGKSGDRENLKKETAVLPSYGDLKNYNVVHFLQLWCVRLYLCHMC